MADRSVERYISLAGALVKITGNSQELFEDPDILRPFLAQPGKPDRWLHCRIVDAFPRPEGELVFRRVYALGDSYISYIGAVESDPGRAYIRVERRGDVSHAQFLRKEILSGIPPRAVLTALETENLVTSRNGLLFHAACIEYQGQAILFTAPSGTGKSTQADLWCRHRGTRIINGDRIVIRVTDTGVSAMGVPYSGSSGISVNTTLPLRAVVYLSQGRDNAITVLRGVAAFRRIWEGCSVHTWNREDIARASETAAELIRQVPIYHFSCTPDENAVLALEAELKR